MSLISNVKLTYYLICNKLVLLGELFICFHNTVRCLIIGVKLHAIFTVLQCSKLFTSLWSEGGIAVCSGVHNLFFHIKTTV